MIQIASNGKTLVAPSVWNILTTQSCSYARLMKKAAVLSCVTLATVTPTVLTSSVSPLTSPHHQSSRGPTALQIRTHHHPLCPPKLFQNLLLKNTIPSENPTKPKLVCPLCRGSINGWVVVESARNFMNAKSRSCACETCDYSGAYKDLRKHARSVHPLVRPTDVDPDRQHDWRRLERQRDLEDLLSTLQSSIGGGGEEERTLTIDEGGWLTVLLLVRFIGTGSSSNRSDSNSTPRAGGAQGVARRSLRRLWGEMLDGETDSEDDHLPLSRRIVPRRYVRRRYNNNRENQ